MKKTKKNLKGMTLIEIVISIALYAVIALVMVQICFNVTTMKRATYEFNNKQSYQAPIAENQIVGNADQVDASNSASADPVSITVSVTGGGSTVITADKYVAAINPAVDDTFHTNHNFKFFVVDTAAAGEIVGETTDSDSSETESETTT